MCSHIIRQDAAHVFDRLCQNGMSPDVFAGKKIFVTGCAGFLGRLFCEFFVPELARRGQAPDKVVLADNFMFGKPSWLKNIAAAAPNCEIRQLDIARPGPVADDVGTFHYIVHMASIASPTFYRKYPFETLDANIGGLRFLIDRADADVLQGLLFFSSSEIYGDPGPEAIPTPESYPGNVNCRGPRACYDEAKRLGETLCHLATTVRNLPVSTVRPFNNYGPGMRISDKRVPADFASAVLANRDIVILSSGAPTRTFCYVADAVFGYLLALIKGAGKVFNIGSPGPEITIDELAEIYARVGRENHGYSGSVRHAVPDEADYLTHNPQRRCPDIAFAREVLGFSPATGLADGIRRYLEHLAVEPET